MKLKIILASLLTSVAVYGFELPPVLDGESSTESHHTAIAVHLKDVAPKKKFDIVIVRTPGAESEITASIISVNKSSISFLFKDNYGNSGKGTIKPQGDEKYLIDLEPLKLIEPRTAGLMGTYELSNPKKPK